MKRDVLTVTVLGLTAFVVATAFGAPDDGRPQPGGFSRFRFDAGESVPALYYDAYRSVEVGSQAEVAVVVIHGWGGHVKTLLPTFVKALSQRAESEMKVPYVLAPMFPRRETLKTNREPDDGRAVWGDSWANEELHPEQMGLAADDWRGGGDANGTSFSSYDYIDLIFNRFADRIRYPNLKRVILAGFSAGGQFVGRYAATGKGVVREGVKVDYLGMSPSTEFLFEHDQPWLYGLKDRPRYSANLSEAEIMANLCSRRVWRGCGSQDILGRPQTSLDMTTPAAAQGKNRFERFRNFERYLDKYPEWKKQVSFHVFEGVGHKEDICYADPALLDFVMGPDMRIADAAGGKTRYPNWREMLPRPVFDEDPRLIDFYYRAWELSHARVDEIPGLPAPRYMDEAHMSNTIWIWDTCFMVHFCKYCPLEFPGIESLENFYGVLLSDKNTPLPKVLGNVWCGPYNGKMIDFRIHLADNPPLFAWTEYVYALQTGDRARLKKVYEEKRWLQRWYDYFDSLDADGPKPYGASCRVSLKNRGKGYRWSGGSSGMDNTPRGRRGVDDRGHEADCPNDKDLLWVDAIAQQGLSALYLSRIASLLGDEAGAKEWNSRYEAIKTQVNTLYWNQADGTYYDIWESTGEPCKVFSSASYWPVLAEMASKAQSERMFASICDDRKFGGVMPMPSLSRDDPDFHADGTYWRGSMWLPTAYMAMKAADVYGDYRTARTASRKIVDMMYRTYVEFEPHTIWECYSPTEPKPATNKRHEYVRYDFCGWSALGPISLFLEDVIGIKQADAFANTLVCDFEKEPKGRVGVERYRFGGITCSVVATKDAVAVRSNGDFTLIVDGVRRQVRAGTNMFARKGE